MSLRLRRRRLTWLSLDEEDSDLTRFWSYIIGAIQAAIVAIGLTGFWTELIYGLIIILSVSMHTILLKRAK